MDQNHHPHSDTADATPASSPDAVLSYHPAFCQLALPLRAGKGPWSRDVGTAAVSMTAGAAELPLPGGKLLRVLLLAIMDAAVRGGSAAADLGPSATSLAERFGLETTPAKLRDLTEQLDRIVAAKITVSTDGGPALNLFDGRSRPAVDDAGWRSTLKLSAKFFASLVEKPVALDPAVVTALVAQPATFDLYAAVAFATAELEPSQSAATGWDDLLTRFGTSGQQMETFRPQIEESLRTISGLCPLYSLIVADRGVEVRKVPPRATPVRAPKPPPPAPVVVPQAVQPDLLAPLPSPVVAQPAPASEPVPPPAPEPVPPPAPPPAAQPAQSAQQAQQQRRPWQQMMPLKSHLTGLQQVVWLQRANGRDDPLVEITPGGRYDPATVTVLALEPVVVQIAGGLYQRDFDRVSAWTMANRDLIDAFWYNEVDDQDEITARVKKVPAPGWRE